MILIPRRQLSDYSRQLRAIWLCRPLVRRLTIPTGRLIFFYWSAGFEPVHHIQIVILLAGGKYAKPVTRLWAAFRAVFSTSWKKSPMLQTFMILSWTSCCLTWLLLVSNFYFLHFFLTKPFFPLFRSNFSARARYFVRWPNLWCLGAVGFGSVSTHFLFP